MRLVFDGLEKAVEIPAGHPAVLQVENQALFSRLIQAISSQEGRFAIEPYSVWNDGSEIAPKMATLLISDVFDLPWGDRSLLGEVLKRIEKDLIDDEEARLDLENAERLFASRLMTLTAGLSADYAFGIEWDLGRSLKMLGFGVDAMPGYKLIDNLITFLSLVLDSKCQKILVFVNLKTFLTKNELKLFYEHVFYTGTHVVLFENKQDNNSYQHERKYTVDQDFLEY